MDAKRRFCGPLAARVSVTVDTPQHFSFGPFEPGTILERMDFSLRASSASGVALIAAAFSNERIDGSLVDPTTTFNNQDPVYPPPFGDATNAITIVLGAANTQSTFSFPIQREIMQRGKYFNVRLFASVGDFSGFTSSVITAISEQIQDVIVADETFGLEMVERKMRKQTVIPPLRSPGGGTFEVGPE